MTLTRRFVTASIAAGLLIVPTLAASAEPSAQEFVEGIYKSYVSGGGKDGNGVPLENDAAIRRYFSPSIAALMIADSRRAARRNDVPTLDADPFVGHQDWEVSKATVEVSESPAGTFATISLINERKPEKISLVLVKTPAGWRVDDVTWTEGSLRGLYRKK